MLKNKSHEERRVHLGQNRGVQPSIFSPADRARAGQGGGGGGWGLTRVCHRLPLLIQENSTDRFRLKESN